MNPYKRELKQVAHYVQSFFNAHSGVHLLYHNAEHTKAVVSAAEQIAEYYQLNDREYFILMAAAWFHDVGHYIENDTMEHEERGVELANAYLEEKGIGSGIITDVVNAILATKLPQNPQTLVEQILCDADLFHLGTDTFNENSKLMRKETGVIKKIQISKEDWREENIQFLEAHQYHTDYCRIHLNARKADNLERLKMKAEKANHTHNNANETLKDITYNGDIDNSDTSSTHSVATSLAMTKSPFLQENSIRKSKKELKAERKNSNRPERGVETVFRVTSSNNQQLSAQADNKANIMITVNSIIVSVMLSVLLSSIQGHPHLTIPTIILLTVNVSTIIFAVLATRPNIPTGVFDPHDVDTKKVNLLFFGNFYNMSLDDYTRGMLKLMEDSDFLYGSLIQDVYFQGLVLGKKYQRLRQSYNIFMYGLVIAVIAFLIALIVFPTTTNTQ